MPEIEKFAKSRMVKDILHGWPHIERILIYGENVNSELRGNWKIIKCAILLHDIGHTENRERHHEISAELAEEFLYSHGITESVILKIKKSILTHSRQFAHEKPATIEAKVVFDADGMDLFGAIGLMRALLSCALQGKDFDCIIKKLEWRLREKSNFYSQIAKKFVAEKCGIIEKYLMELKSQLNSLSVL
jgi:uncharacterized protein